MPGTVTDLRRTGGAASSPLVLSVVLGAIAVAVGLVIRPALTGRFGGFGGDAATIQSIMSSPFDAVDLGYGSYSVIADFYIRIGLSDAPTAAGVLGAVVGATVLAIVLIRVGSVHRGRLSLALAFLAPLTIGIYQAAYTKEIIISLAMLVVVLMPVNWLGELLVIGTLVVLGAEYRTYWLLVAGVYVVVRFVLSRRDGRTVGRVVWMIVLLSVLVGLAMWVTQGVPADSFRGDVNDTASRQSNTGSLITRFIEAPEPVGGVLNSTLTSLFFIVPLPMLLKLSPYYLFIGILFAVIWISAVRAATVAGRSTPMLGRFIALPLAFLVVQGLYEPDWGSALRHATPVIPFIVGAVALSEQARAAPPDVSPSRSTNPRPVRTLMTPRTTDHTDGSSARNVLADYLGHLRRWWWMLVVGLVVGGLVGWGVSAVMPKEYTATSQLYVGTASTGGSADAYNGAMLSQKQVGSYAELANGRALGQRVVDDLGLDKSATDVSEMISASAHKDTVILDLNVATDNAEFSRDVANSAAAQLQAMVHDLNARTSPNGQSGAPQLAVFNDAEVPDSPSSPNTLLNIILGLVLGLVIGAVVAVIRGLTDRRIGGSDEVREIVDAPVVGTIGTTEALAERHTIDFTAAPTPVAEQFRELRTNLRFLDVDNAPTVLAVTSGMPGEGKSTLAVNLALALADDGENVCLVDGDLRNPSVATYAGGNLQSAVGLSTALSGAAEVDDVVQLTAVDGLSVITSGPIPPNPAELLGSRRFGEVLATLAAHFDHVIIDASPTLPVTDGALVAASADGVILAVRHNHTTTDQLTATVDGLDAVNARVLGAVVTLTPSAKGKGYHRYGYGYGATSHSTPAVTTGETAEDAASSEPAPAQSAAHRADDIRENAQERAEVEN
ncbi:polysaccharide biosynthesis tyrosine autokinase [Corynebacterium variabile]|uniref:polysaccharide biosynthesis tyrosine autokinase n=1 Tax=Corynebacterium variabile TaxID=1727 RepID=UPI0028A8AFB5|nr:polysaccharide biosynthesis tyrosine autokinase [Corynebacterium variabile]